MSNVGPRGGCLYVALGMFATLLAASALVSYSIFGIISYARGADLPIPPSPQYRGNPGMDLSKFGVYGDRYYARRWKKLCAGGGRYIAMAEAYDLGKRDPCNGGQ